MTTSTFEPVAKLSSPGDIVVMIPYLLGFEPRDSLVLVSLEGPRKRFGPVMRIDLVDGPARQVAEQVEYLLAFVEAHRFRDVIAVAYTADARRAGRVVRPLVERLRADRVRVTEALRADGGRWYSYSCRRQCCPPAGTPYDRESARPAAEAVASGLTRAESREALRAVFEPTAADPVDAVQALVPGLLAEVADGSMDKARIDALLDGGDDAYVRQLATALVLAQDDGWGPRILVRLRRDQAWDQFELWAAVMRVATDEQLAGPGALAAFAAWLDGNGVLASHAVDRVQTIDPNHPLAALVRSLLDHTVPPFIWEDLDPDEP